ARIPVNATIKSKSTETVYISGSQYTKADSTLIGGYLVNNYNRYYLVYS
ncbi:MAG: hypothetical protein RIR73_230, partial [Chloroflexota bacterium]